MAMMVVLASLMLSQPAWAAPQAVSASRPRVLSEEPRIEYRSNFLNAADVTALRKLAISLGFEGMNERSTETNGGEEFCVLNKTAALEEAIDEEEVDFETADGWEAAARFESAAGKWAQRPVGGTSAVVTRWEPWVPAFNRSGLLHLDARFRPSHQFTVLSYLSGGKSSGSKKGGDADDGFTVFPCIETEDMDQKEAARRHRLCSRAQRHVQHVHDKLLRTHAEGLELPPEKQLAFLEEHPELVTLQKQGANGTRPVDWLWTAAFDAVAESPGSSRADPLFAVADSMCRGQAPGLRVAAESGAAVLIEASSRDRRGRFVPDWRLWHAGCSPLPSRGRRWTVQLFMNGEPAMIREKRNRNPGHRADSDSCSRADGASCVQRSQA